MKLSTVARAWNKFFFAPQSPTPLALFRILYGWLIAATLVLQHGDWLNWYGRHGWVSLDTVSQAESGARIDIFKIIPQSDAWTAALFWIFLASAVLLSLGFLTRLNSVVVFVCLTSLHQRNPYILHSGDVFLRVAGFFLMFAPAGAALSVDRWIRVRRGKAGPRPDFKSPWAQRMIQFELALLYFAAFCWKAQGAPWLDGTALFYVYHLDELRRFPVPSWFLHPALLRMGGWFAMALEFSLGTLIWIKELRYYLLALGLLFHLFLEYSMNIPMFEWDVLAAYVLFIDAADLARASKWIRARIRRKATASK